MAVTRLADSVVLLVGDRTLVNGLRMVSPQVGVCVLGAAFPPARWRSECSRSRYWDGLGQRPFMCGGYSKFGRQAFTDRGADLEDWQLSSEADASGAYRSTTER